MHRFSAWIRTRYWVEQLLLWPIYFTLWCIREILSGIWWLLTEAYGQTNHALQQFVRRNLWMILLVGGLVLLYLFDPRLLGPLLQLGLVLLVMWACLTMMWRSALPRKKRKQNHHE